MNTRNMVTNSSRRKGKRRQNQVGQVGRYAEDAFSLGKRTLKGLNELRKLINIEFKRFDVTVTGGTTSQAGAVAQLSQIAQGTDFNTRVGDSIRTQHICFNAQYFLTGASVQAIVRCIIVRDNENTGSAPSGSDVLTQAGTANATVSPHSYINFPIGQTQGRFKVLFDEITSMSSTGEINALMHHEQPLGQHIRYKGSLATDTREGSLWIMFFTNLAAATPTVDWSVYVTYTDD